MSVLISKIEDNGVRIGLCFAVLLFYLSHAADWFRIGFISQMENIAYDKRLLLTMPETVDNRIVIVDIDEASLTAEGRWPWGRDKLSHLVESLFDKYEVAIVGFDIVFAEPDESSGLNVLEQLAENQLKANEMFRAQLQVLRPHLDYDGRFSETIQQYPVVLGYYFNFVADREEASKIGQLPSPTFVKGTFKGKRIAFHVADGFGANLQQLESSAMGSGHFNPVPDPDGVIRRVPMLIEYEDEYYSSLSLEVVRHLLGSKEVKPRFEKPLFGGKGYAGLEWLTVANKLIPVDRRLQTLVPYRGAKGSYPYVSATDVLHGNADKAVLKGATVLVGTTAPGLFDLRSTPVAEAFPGVEVHANLISGMLDGTIKQLPEYALGAEVLLLLLFGLVMAIVVPLLSPLAATIATASLLLLYFGFNFLVWTAGNFVLPLASGIMMLLSMFVLNMSYGYFVETRGKRQITGLFGQYIPPELVDEMADHPADYSLDARSKELTVLFSDVRGFTTISEGLAPTELAELMNLFLTPMTRVIHEQRGTIDKYMGDAIMAFWGAPIDDRDHAKHALDAGMQMLQRLDEVNAQFVSRGWPEIQIGIGINTGMMSVGNMGSEFRIAYTVLGDAVNLGSRLEGLTKGYCVPLIVSESTKDAVPEYAYRELDRVRVKGKDKPVVIYQPLCLVEDLDKEWKAELKLYREALRLYRGQEWDMAEMNLLNLQRISRSPGLYKVYVERVAQYRASAPPRGWDGVYTFTAK
ncbi:MAG: adenylate/guanylate cyclase domain-containing protein [Proteobacteria bacterium]|nr:adenylate/guanylate cyclase domain-containing protein [Pseudomonadota bacterium]